MKLVARWIVGLVIAVPVLGFAPLTASPAGLRERSSCTDPTAPVAHDHTDGSSAPTVSQITDAAVPWQTAGAQVAEVPAADARAIRFSVTLDGTTRTFTTAPYPPGRNYGSRGMGPADTSFGTIVVEKGPESTYVGFRRNDSGSADLYAFRFDGTCGSAPAPTPATGAAPPPAVPRPGTATYTG